MTQNLKKISTHLAGLGFPENVLGDLQAQGLRDCAGALRVVVKQDDYPGNKGRKVTEKTETGYRETVIYDTENLHITSVAVELSRDNRQWRIFHHFSWTSNPGFLRHGCCDCLYGILFYRQLDDTV